MTPEPKKKQEFQENKRIKALLSAGLRLECLKKVVLKDFKAIDDEPDEIDLLT